MAEIQPEKMKGTTLDIAAENRARLKQLFPTVFTETRNDKGELVESVDFEKLKAELGTFSDFFEARRERYGMEWPGKREALRLIQTLSSATLKPCREESVNFDTTENLFIEGDNLEVLKLLQTSYYGKVKMIYIDPPYNTGKEFIYPDNFSESLETYLEYAGLIDGEGKKCSTNTANEGRFHTKWLNMMYPRLYLARNLLRDDGVIFISIDDNEVSNLRKLCDEIFGEENFVANVVWQKKYGPANDAKGISATHEFIICYGKNIEYWMPGLLERTEEQLTAFKNPDNDPRGDWRASDLSARTFSESGFYAIKDPTGKEFLPPQSRSWIVNERRYYELLQDNRITFGADGMGRPMQKRFLSEVKVGITPETWWDREKAGDNKIARYEIKDIFPENIFDTPKPTKLVSLALSISGSVQNDIILDFFAGSATTAHAVLDLNKQDNGNRKFILVQLPEPCAPDSEAFKAGYKTIADIGKERIRRVINKLSTQSLTPQPPLQGEGGKSTEMVDGSSSSLPSGEGRGGALDSIAKGGASNSARGRALYATANPTLWDSLKVNARDMRKNPTPAENALWQEVRDKKWGVAFRRQHAIEQFIADFVCLEHKLIVEVDGDIHRYQTERDAERTAILESLGYTVVRFSNEEVLHNIQHVKSSILNILTTLRPPSSPLPSGEVHGSVSSSLPSGEGRGGALDSAQCGALGFKVFKLDKSNFRQWQKLEPSATTEQILNQLALHIDHIDAKATQEALLYEILLKAGFTLTEKIETKIICGKELYSVSDGALLLCLEESVTKELIDAVIELNPQQFLCLDSAFHGNDQLKANAVQTFNAHNMQKEKHNQILFKTV